MSTVIARKIAASPVRTNPEAWEVVCVLLAPDAGSPARSVLDRATGVACSSIASETLAGEPIVVYGSGPRIRLYALYDEDATSGEDTSEGALPEVPTKGDWRMSIPCPDEDYEWCARAIKACAPHVSVRRIGEAVPEEKSNAGSAAVQVNTREFLQS